MSGLITQLQVPTQFWSLTQAVSQFIDGSQLQTLKTFRLGEEWAVGFELYPGPGFVTLALRGDGETVFIQGKQKLSASAHPFQLYVKAHFLNARVAQVRSVGATGEERLEFEFEESGKRMIWDLLKGQLHVTLEVSGRKPFHQTLRLARFEAAPDDAARSTVETELPVVSPKETPEARKHRRLTDNIRRDIEVAETWLTRFGAFCDRMAADPSLWKRSAEWPAEDAALINEEVRAGHLPQPSASNTGPALEALFHLRKRSQRKIEGGKQRLKKVEAQGPARRTLAPTQSPAIPQPSPKPRKKPGTWVPLTEKIWARVGRSSDENDELFRQSRDRDLWFHVRGAAGAHVWIPRGQPGFGAKDELNDDVHALGCQLALINSKSVKSGQAFVDFTERRNLRKIKGAVGQVEILRSQTRHVRLDEEFERRIMKREG